MRVMVFVPGDKDSEAGKTPSEELISKMMKFNEELVKAGVMLDGQGLAPTSRAKRVRFSGSERTVIDGPFAETKELVAGYWIWQVRATLRPIFEPEDFGAELTPELRAKEEQLRAELSRQR